MKTYARWLPLVLLLSGCAMMEAMGLYSPATEQPTPLGDAFNEVVRGLTGFDVAAIWAGWKTLTTVATERGRQNLANLSKKGIKGKALAALLVGSHTPPAPDAPEKST